MKQSWGKFIRRKGSKREASLGLQKLAAISTTCSAELSGPEPIHANILYKIYSGENLFPEHFLFHEKEEQTHLHLPILEESSGLENSISRIKRPTRSRSSLGTYDNKILYCSQEKRRFQSSDHRDFRFVRADWSR